jgi:prophage DNA circulation protein
MKFDSMHRSIQHQEDQDRVHFALLQAQKDSLENMQVRIETVDTQCDSMHGKISGVLDSVQQITDDSKVASSARHKELINMLKSLDDRLSGLVSNSESSGNSYPTARVAQVHFNGTQSKEAILVEHAALIEAIDRLCQLAHEDECLIEADAVQEIVNDLQKLLLHVGKACHGMNRRGNGQFASYKAHQKSKNESDLQVMSRVAGMFLAAPLLSINGRGKSLC